ncbi:hypothetical protein MMC25_004109 [Agyrium rufum]|nr:hypothetical protein [Agyrium rufum]
MEPTNFVYPSGLKLALLMTSTFIGMFLVALDKLIITTAIPQITNDFHSSNDVGWYGTAYLLTNCAFLLVFGKIYTFMNVKATFLTAVAFFEVGSVLCGAAPNSIAFIVGRAIAGLGAAGVQGGVIVIVVYAIPLHNRPKFQGMFGAVFGIASVVGPLVGGAFTTNITWRWCFYINIPLGALVMVFVYFLLEIPARPITAGTWKQKLQQLNLESVLALVPGVSCLCLALQWGGFTYSWSSGRVVALLVIGIVLLVAFGLVQVLRPERAMVPPRIFVQRSILGGFWVSILIGAHQVLNVYYLPIWFQAIKGSSAIKSGIQILPLILSLVLASIITGILTSKIGYYMPFLIGGICVTAVGEGLITTFGINATPGQWIGYQVIYGYGLGSSFMSPSMAAQTVLQDNDVSIGASLMIFGQTLSGAIFVSVGQNVLGNQLATRLADITSITPQQIEEAGITGLFKIVPTQYHTAVLEAYNDSLRVVFRVAVILACLSILGALVMEWRSVKAKRVNSGQKDVDSEKAVDEAEGKPASIDTDLEEKVESEAIEVPTMATKK